MGASISAEDGIGTQRRSYLHLAQRAADIAATRAIKTALDPVGLLNPGVLL
jgi:FAD/FMN-containing dehydrogenase